MKSILACLLALVLTARGDLAGYVARPEAEAKWSVKTTTEFGGCEVVQLELTSQVWEGIPWQHDLVIFRPKDAPPSDMVFLLNNGGKAKPTGLPYGAMLAQKTRCTVALLLGIPNQPLFDGKREDDLIAETFVRYLETGDAAWPLLFPMVKSARQSDGRHPGDERGVAAEGGALHRRPARASAAGRRGSPRRAIRA